MREIESGSDGGHGAWSEPGGSSGGAGEPSDAPAPSAANGDSPWPWERPTAEAPAQESGSDANSGPSDTAQRPESAGAGISGAPSGPPLPGVGYPTGGYGPPPPGVGVPPSTASRPPRRGTTTLVTAAVVAGLVGGGVGAVAVHAWDGSGSSGNAAVATEQVAPPVTGTAQPAGGSVSQVAQQVLPSVVSITATDGNNVDEGSGVVLSTSGYILTNNHVIATAENAGGTSGAPVPNGDLVVTFNDNTTVPASIVGADTSSDLAVIKVSKAGLKPAVLGNSGPLQVGQPVVAIGSPLGLSGTVTSGIVSALNRPVNTTASQQQEGNPGQGGGASTAETVIDAIQTDSAINPGNSGGPLVNMQGEVVGINSAIASLGSGSASGQSGSIGVGFSIPIDEARPIANQLIQSGHAVHAVLGVGPTDATTSNGIVQLGAKIVSVSAGSPAAKADIQIGDVITQVGDRPIDSADALVAAIRSHQPGEQVSVTFSRNGQKKTVTVTLTSAG